MENVNTFQQFTEGEGTVVWNTYPLQGRSFPKHNTLLSEENTQLPFLARSTALFEGSNGVEKGDVCNNCVQLGFQASQHCGRGKHAHLQPRTKGDGRFVIAYGKSNPVNYIEALTEIARRRERGPRRGQGASSPKRKQRPSPKKTFGRKFSNSHEIRVVGPNFDR